MSPEGIAAILVAGGTFITGLILALRGVSGDKFQRKVTESAALLSGYTEMVKNLRAEVAAIRDQHAADMERQQRQHDADLATQQQLHDAERMRWMAERVRLEERIETQEAQIAAFLLRPKSSRERKSDQ